MKRFNLILLTGMLSLVVFSACGQEERGRELYMQHCAQCHGEDLTGGNAQSLIDGVWQYGGEDHYKQRNIKFGIPHVGMPAYNETLSDQEISQVIAFMNDFEAEKGKDKAEVPIDLLTLDYQMEMEVIAEGLDIPWAIDFIDQDSFLVTERPGRLRIIENSRLMEEPVRNTPEVVPEGQGGLMDVALDPQFDQNGWIYLAYSHGLKQQGSSERIPAMTRIVRGRIKDHTWTDQQVIYESIWHRDPGVEPTVDP